MSILLPIGVALFVLPLVLLAMYARRVENRQRKRLFGVDSFSDKKVA
jgi:hypothetical protein